MEAPTNKPVTIGGVAAIKCCVDDVMSRCSTWRSCHPTMKSKLKKNSII